MKARSFAQRYGDSLLAAVLTVSICAELFSWVDSGLPTALACGALSTVPLAWRRKLPLVSFVLVMLGIQLLGRVEPGFDNDSLSFVLAYLITLYSLGRHASGVEARWGAAGVVVVMVLFNLSEGGVEQTDLGDVAFLIGFIGAPWAAGLALRLRREREAQLNEENERLRREQEARERRAVAEERARIARELHDVVAHAISVTVLQSRGARHAMATDPGAVRQALDAIERTNTAALGDMRRLLAVLRDTESEDGPLDHPDRAPQPSLEHLDQLVEHVREAGVPVTLEVRGTRQAVPPGVDLSAYRIVQEALTNVLKHAARGQAHVVLEYTDDSLTVTVVNDGLQGPHVEPATGTGNGLIGIQERVAVVGGEVTAGPRPAGGYEIRARLPFSVVAT